MRRGPGRTAARSTPPTIRSSPTRGTAPNPAGTCASSTACSPQRQSQRIRSREGGADVAEDAELDAAACIERIAAHAVVEPLDVGTHDNAALGTDPMLDRNPGQHRALSEDVR